MPREPVEVEPQQSRDAPANAAFFAAFALCTLAALCALWLPKYLPMTDLPQHAAQISIWKHLHEPSYGFGERFELQYFTPYLLGYGLARLFAELFSILAAMKLVLTLTVLALPLALWRLLRACGGDRWWCLLGFPLAFGFSFLWGFFNYVVAIPIGIYYLAFAVDYARAYSVRRALALGLLTVLLLAAHLIIFVSCGLAAAVLIGLSSKSLKAAAIRLAPLGFGLLAALVWAARYQSNAVLPNVFRYGLGRITELPALLLAYPPDDLAPGVGTAFIVLFAISGVRLARQRARWLPLALWFVAYLALPQNFGNAAFLYPRLAVLLVPFAIVATESGASRVRPQLVHAALAATALAWLCLVLSTFYSFDRDARQLDLVVQRMEPNKRVRSLIFERGAEYTPGGRPFVHFAAWYQVEKGGTISYSFASTQLSVAVFRPEKRAMANTAIDWQPERFDVRREQDDYDYFLVRAKDDLGPVLFRGGTRRIYLHARQGSWWLYRCGEPLPKASPPAPSRDKP